MYNDHFLLRKSFAYNHRGECYTQYKCKTQIDVQPLIDVQSSNPCLISTSQTSVPQIYVLFSNSQIGVQFSNLCPFSNLQISIPILKSMAISHFLKLTSNDVTDLCQNNNPNPNQQLRHRSENLERTLI